MHKSATILILSLFWFPSVLAQQTKNKQKPNGKNKKLTTSYIISKSLLYVVESKNHLNYLVPYIEQKLRNLRIAQKDEKLYDKVSSLNTLTEMSTIEGEIITNLIDNRVTKNVKKDNKNSTYGIMSYEKFLKKYQDVLLIKINLLGSLIEIQFTHFNRKNDGQLEYNSSSSVFVNPEKPHYQAELIRALKQVFPLAGSKPIFKISSNIKFSDSTKTFYVNSKDTLILNPIIQSDSPEEDLQFFWTQKFNSSPDFKLLRLEGTSKNQRLVNLQEGRYEVTFHMTDGILESDTATVYIEVSNPSKLIVNSKIQHFFFDQQILIIDKSLVNNYANIRMSNSFNVQSLDSIFKRSAYLEFILKGKYKYSIASEKGHFLGDGIDITESNFVDFIPDTAMHTFNKMKSGRYQLNFYAKTEYLRSDTVKANIYIFNKRRISLLYECMILPIHNSGYRGQGAFGVGTNFALERELSMDMLIGGVGTFKRFTNMSYLINLNFHNLIVDRMTTSFSFFRPMLSGSNSKVYIGLKPTYEIFDFLVYNLKAGLIYYISPSNKSIRQQLFGFTLSTQLFLKK